jgi:hypothetical protein
MLNGLLNIFPRLKKYRKSNLDRIPDSEINSFNDKRDKANHLDDVETDYSSYDSYKQSKSLQRDHIGEY